MSTEEDTVSQSGVIPYRIDDERVEILLITSSTRKRWIIPKGKLESQLSPSESAGKEAFEEAGVRGSVRRAPFGRYEHSTATGPERIEVFLMRVEKELENWPERNRRKRQWMTIQEARDRVLEPGLKRLLEELEEIFSDS